MPSLSVLSRIIFAFALIGSWYFAFYVHFGAPPDDAGNKAGYEILKKMEMFLWVLPMLIYSFLKGWTAFTTITSRKKIEGIILAILSIIIIFVFLYESFMS